MRPFFGLVYISSSILFRLSALYFFFNEFIEIELCASLRLGEGVIQIDEFQSRNHMSVHIEILHASSIIESNDRHPFRPLRTM